MTNDSPPSATAYTEPYRHFDNLIWAIPAWGSAVFALVFQAMSTETIGAFAELVDMPTRAMVALLGYFGAATLLVFSQVMYRLRVNQARVHDQKNLHITWLGGSFLGQALLVSQSALLAWISTRALQTPPVVQTLVWIFAIVLLIAYTVFLRRERLAARKGWGI